ncbi:YjbQ family protein [Ignavigranum ruoffiae]
MKLYKETLMIDTQADKTTYVDITTEVQTVIQESGIQEGMVTVITPHTTCSVFFEEYSHDIDEKGDEFLQADLNEVLAKLIPAHDSAETYHYPGEAHYQAVESWPDADKYLPNGDRKALWNGDAHLKATLIGSSQSFDVSNNRLGVGTTGYIYFADFDTTRERTRQCKIIVMGE